MRKPKHTLQLCLWPCRCGVSMQSFQIVPHIYDPWISPTDLAFGDGLHKFGPLGIRDVFVCLCNLPIFLRKSLTQWPVRPKRRSLAGFFYSTLVWISLREDWAESPSGEKELRGLAVMCNCFGFFNHVKSG